MTIEFMILVAAWCGSSVSGYQTVFFYGRHSRPAEVVQKCREIAISCYKDADQLSCLSKIKYEEDAP